MREKNGRVTFMPLNRLHPKNPPTPNAQDAIPLIDKLRFDPMHLKAFQQVFGKTCVCRDLTIAAAYVNGLQSTGVSACIKHFATNDQEFERYAPPFSPSSWTLFSLYHDGLDSQSVAK